MSVLMTMRIAGDPKAIEGTESSVTKTIVDRAKENGLISHRFFGSDDEILVVDEWPDEQSFHRFFDASPEIGEMMRQAGITTEPTVEFWHPLDMDDRVG